MEMFKFDESFLGGIATRGEFDVGGGKCGDYVVEGTKTYKITCSKGGYREAKRIKTR